MKRFDGVIVMGNNGVKEKNSEIIYLCRKCKSPVPIATVLSGSATCDKCILANAVKEKQKPRLVVLVDDQTIIKRIED